MSSVLRLDGISFSKGESINDQHLEILQNWKKVSILLSDTIDQLRTARSNAIKDKNRHKSLLIKYKNNYETCKKQLDDLISNGKTLKNLADKGEEYNKFCLDFNNIASNMKSCLEQVIEKKEKIESLEQNLNEAEIEYQNINHQDIKNHHNLSLSQKKASHILSLIQQIDKNKSENEKLILTYQKLKQKLISFNEDTNETMKIIFEQLDEFDLIIKSDKISLNSLTLSKDLNLLINENINDYANSDQETEIDDYQKMDTFDNLENDINLGKIKLTSGNESDDSDYYYDDYSKSTDLINDLASKKTVAEILIQAEQ